MQFSNRELCRSATEARLVSNTPSTIRKKRQRKNVTKLSYNSTPLTSYSSTGGGMRSLNRGETDISHVAQDLFGDARILWL